MTAWFDRDDDVIVQTRPELVWHLAERAPRLADRVLAASPSLAEPLERLRSHVPVPRRRVPSDAAPFFRFTGHGRSFCVAYATEGDPDGHLVFKGSEHIAADFDEWLDEQAVRRLRITARQETHFTADGGVEAEMRLLDKWAVLEGKIPGACTLDEAVGEAEIAATVQEAFTASFGATARAPLPLLAYRWPQQCVDRVRAALLPRLSAGAFTIAERRLKSGLGMYVYYYPGFPVRLAQLAIADAAELGLAARLEQIDEIFDWRHTAESWIDLTAKLIALGFLPKSPASVVTGDCLQFQNMVLDGGIADLDSVIHVDAVHEERELRDILRRTLLELTKSLATLLLGGPAQDAAFLRRFPDVSGLVGAELAKRLQAIGATGRLHPRIGALLREGSWLDRLREAFEPSF
jgi:hypothetical protein